MLGHAPLPIWVLTEVLEGDAQGWQLFVHQVRFVGGRTEYGWGEERAHARGTRYDAHGWVFFEGPIEYLDEHHVWHVAP